MSDTTAINEPGCFYKKLDPGIRELVRALHRNGIPTIGSCQGHIDEGRTPYPYVAIDLGKIPPDTLKRLVGLIAGFNMPDPNSPRDDLWALVPARGHNWNTVVELSPYMGNPGMSSYLLESLRAGAEELSRLLSGKG